MKKKTKKIHRNKIDKDGYEYNFEGLNAKRLVPSSPPEGFPSPEELAKRMKNAKVTIILDRDTVEFFKLQAENHGSKYQKMMREILKDYRIRFENRAA